MLTRIEIDGFKTFRDFALDVPPFLVVLGRNASGKSNLFDAIRFIGCCADSTLVVAVQDARGELAELLHRYEDGQRVRRMRFVVEVLLPAHATDDFGERIEIPHTRVRYSLELEVRSAGSGDRLFVVDEAVDRIGADNDHWADQLPPRSRKSLLRYDGRSAPLLLTTEGREGRAVRVDTGGPAVVEIRATEARRTVLSTMGAATVPDPTLFALRKELLSWRIFHPESSALRSPSGWDDTDQLGTDGRRLANALRQLADLTGTRDRPRGAVNDIVADLAAIVPGIRGIEIEENELSHQRAVTVASRGGEAVPARVASDGTLRALALLVAVYGQEGFGLVGLEEIENGIHPERGLPQLVRRIRDMVLGGLDSVGRTPSVLRQVIVSTHSPAILAALEPVSDVDSRGGNVVFLDLVARVGEGRKSRVTRVRRVAQTPDENTSPDLVVTRHEIPTFMANDERAVR